MKHIKCNIKSFLFLLLFVNSAICQVGINTTTPNASSILDISSNNKGLLIPRMTAAQRTAILLPATGLLVYQTNLISGFYYFDGTNWIGLSDSLVWDLVGNSGTSPLTNFIGTTDLQDFVIRTNNTEKMRVTSAGNIGIGINAPTQKLDVQGGNARINNAYIGTFGFVTDWAGFSNASSVSMTGYGLLQSSNGAHTFINKENTGGGYIGFRVGNVDKVIITNNGDMGIGNTFPGSKLDVTGSSDFTPAIRGVNYSFVGSFARGVHGETFSSDSGAAGVYGLSSYNSTLGFGVLGEYVGYGSGVVGLGFNSYYTDIPDVRDYGVCGLNGSSPGVGVYAKDVINLPGSYAFYGVGKFSVTGAKAASVPTTKGNQLLYCTESPEIWFEDLGGGKLVNGSTHIALDDMFLETVFIDENHKMRVFIQEEGESNGLIVIKDLDGKGFTVRERNGGNSNIEFSYRVMAKRRFYQDQRFGVDSNQPFENNLIKAKDAPLITRDPQEMKQFVEEQKKMKELLLKSIKKPVKVN